MGDMVKATSMREKVSEVQVFLETICNFTQFTLVLLKSVSTKSDPIKSNTKIENNYK